MFVPFNPAEFGGVSFYFSDKKCPVFKAGHNNKINKSNQHTGKSYLIQLQLQLHG
jgi:hypothetical protein